MQKMTATEAKQNFGELLHKAQQEPIEITRNGRRVGVLVSDEWFSFNQWKEQQDMEKRLVQSRGQAERGETIPSKEVFAEVRENIRDWSDGNKDNS